MLASNYSSIGKMKPRKGHEKDTRPGLAGTSGAARAATTATFPREPCITMGEAGPSAQGRTSPRLVPKRAGLPLGPARSFSIAPLGPPIWQKSLGRGPGMPIKERFRNTFQNQLVVSTYFLFSRKTTFAVSHAW